MDGIAAIISALVGTVVGATGLFHLIEFLLGRKDKHLESDEFIATELGRMSDNIEDLREDMHHGQEEILGIIDKNQAIGARIRILSAADEIRHGLQKHSEEYFDQLNDDITLYETYCSEHKDFLNNKASHAISYINNIYQKALQENDFL